jgi:hypothetical protein
MVPSWRAPSNLLSTCHSCHPRRCVQIMHCYVFFSPFPSRARQHSAPHVVLHSCLLHTVVVVDAHALRAGRARACNAIDTRRQSTFESHKHAIAQCDGPHRADLIRRAGRLAYQRVRSIVYHATHVNSVGRTSQTSPVSPSRRRWSDCTMCGRHAIVCSRSPFVHAATAATSPGRSVGTNQRLATLGYD